MTPLKQLLQHLLPLFSLNSTIRYFLKGLENEASLMEEGPYYFQMFREAMEALVEIKPLLSVESRAWFEELEGILQTEIARRHRAASDAEQEAKVQNQRLYELRKTQLQPKDLVTCTQWANAEIPQQLRGQEYIFIPDPMMPVIKTKVIRNRRFQVVRFDETTHRIVLVGGKQMMGWHSHSQKEKTFTKEFSVSAATITAKVVNNQEVPLMNLVAPSHEEIAHG